MIKLFKGLVAIFVLATTASLIMALHSCKSDEAEMNNRTPQVQLLNKYDSYIHHFVSAPIVDNVNRPAKVIPSNGLTQTTLPKGNDIKNIYVKYPEGTAVEIKNLYYYIQNIQDMETLERLTAAEYTTEKPQDEDSLYCIQLSETAIRKELSPLLQQSKDYLKAKGITDEDIEQMLEIYDADENVLIPFALVLADHEMNEENQNATAQKKASILNPFNIFVTPTYALSERNKMVFDCALSAVGIDVLAALGQSTCKNWGTRLIMKAFGTVAKKVVGPIGVATTVVSFGMCLHNKGCIYSVVSPIEDRFNKITNDGNSHGITFK